MRDSALVPVQRLMALRQYPGFADAELAELAVLAENVVEEELPAGTVVTPAGQVPPLHLVLDGRLQLGPHQLGVRALAGSLAAMAGRPLQTPMIAATDTRTLRVSARDFLDILEDNFGLLSAARRYVAQHLIALRLRPAPFHPILRRQKVATFPAGASGVVDRLLALRQLAPLSRGRIHALVALASAARETRWPAGATLVRAGEAARASYIVLEGTVGLEGGSVELGSGDSFGAIELLAERPYLATAVARSPVRALECPATAIHDVCEDHTDFAMAVLARLSGELLDEAGRCTAHAQRGDRGAMP